MEGRNMFQVGDGARVHPNRRAPSDGNGIANGYERTDETDEQGPFCGVEEIERLTGRKKRTLYTWAKQGKIPAPINGLWDRQGVRESLRALMRSSAGIPYNLETDP